MPTTGGRGDIGPTTYWNTQWLYTGDWRERATALGMADLALAWPLNLRESNSAKKIDKAQTVSGLGKTITVYSYPTSWIPDNNGNNPLLLPTPRAAAPATGSWVPDGAHQPDPFSVPYILTGDYTYLEEMQFWAGAQSVAYNPGYRGADAGVDDQIRGDAWVLRNRVNASFLSPDGSPERSIFSDMVSDAIAMWEGERNIADSNLQSNFEYSWGKTAAGGNFNPSPLHFFDAESIIGNDGDAFTDASADISPWMNYFLILELGLATEKGYPAGTFFSWCAPMLTGQFTTTGYSPYLSGEYRLPVIAASTQQWLQTWPDVQAHMAPSYVTGAQQGFEQGVYPGEGYPTVAAAASALTAGEPGGGPTWNWLDSHVFATKPADYATSPQWSIVPRSSLNMTPLPAPTPTAASFTIGQQVQTTSNLNVRAAPTTSGTLLGTQPSGSVGTVAGGPTTADGYVWWNITYSSGVSGWSVQDYLVAVSTPTPTPAPVTTMVPPSQWSATAADTLIATTSNATLVAANGIYKVEGLYGINTVILTQPVGGPQGWFTTTYNNDGTVSVTDTHATGYGVTLYNIQNVIFPDGNLATLNVSVVPVPTPTPTPISAPTATLSAAPTALTAGQSTTLTWSSTNATSCTGTNFTTASVTGTIAVTPSVTTTYSLTCVGAGGTSPAASATVTVAPVVVTPPPTPAPAPVSTGPNWSATAADTLIATTSNATLVAANGIYKVEGLYGINTVILTQPVGGPQGWFTTTYNNDGTVSVTDTHATGYGVTLYNIQNVIFPDGNLATLNVSVVPVPTPTPTPISAPTATLSAAPTALTAGQSTTLTWSSTNATSCTGTNFTTASVTGTIAVTPSVTTTYSLTCVGAGGTSPAASATVTVAPVVVTPPPTPAPAPVSTGPNWSATAADTLIATTSNAILVAANGIYKVEGLYGTNTVILTQPVSSSQGWYATTYNNDGTVTITDIHATGYSITLYNIQKVLFPGGGSETLNVPVVPVPAGVLSAAPIVHTLAPGWTGKEVTALQGILQKLGYFNNQITGYFGSLTASAVTAFQQAHSLPAVGVVGPKTRAALNQK